MDLIKTFLYFAVFKHPLTKEEALRFSQYPTRSIDKTLNKLVEQKLIYKIGSYYLPYDHPDWVRRRLNGDELAQKKMKTAKKMAKILTYFPFVRSIMISGSLSKGYMDDKSDIDFFLIMKPGSIAISKFLMGLFRRVFAPKSFCINFIIDSNHLDIQKQNLYTAIEMVTLIPMIDAQLFNEFMARNLHWIRDYLPNASPRNNTALAYRKNLIQTILEFILMTPPMVYLDEQLRNQYTRRLRRNSNKETRRTGEVIIKKGIIKLHNKPYQQKILELYGKYQEQFFKDRELVFEKSFYD